LTKTSDSTHGNSTVSETIEKFSFGSGNAYLDNAELASKGLRFDILEIKFDPGQGYQNQDRWLISIKFPEGEPGLLSLGSNPGRGFDGKDRWALSVKAAGRDCAILTLGCNPKRDEELAAAQAHLDRGGTIANKRLRRSGNAYYLADGER
jgi:hypothetical protein